MYIIDELKELFHENKQVYKKLVIIEHYLSDSIDKYKKSISSTYHLKPSRIEKIITSFEEDTGHAGYIQPIGKAYFLQTFLKKYPTPRFLQFGEEKWTVSILSEYLRVKYNCIITQDTIRKQITQCNKQLEKAKTTGEKEYEKFLENVVTNYISNQSFIYIYHLYYANSSTNTNIQQTDECLRKFVGFIHTYSERLDCPLYKRQPFFQLSFNFDIKTPNLKYYLNIPAEPSLILIRDTPAAREIVKNYYYSFFYFSKATPKYNFYFLPENMDILKTILFNDLEFLDVLRDYMLKYGTEGIKELKKEQLYPEELNTFLEYIIDSRETKTDFFRTPKLFIKKP